MGFEIEEHLDYCITVFLETTYTMGFEKLLLLKDHIPILNPLMFLFHLLPQMIVC